MHEMRYRYFFQVGQGDVFAECPGFQNVFMYLQNSAQVNVTPLAAMEICLGSHNTLFAVKLFFVTEKREKLPHFK